MSFKWEAIDAGTRVACRLSGDVANAISWVSDYEPDSVKLAPVCNTIEDWLRRD